MAFQDHDAPDYDSDVTIETSNRVVTITISHSAKPYPLSCEICRDLQQNFESVVDVDARCDVLAGSGETFTVEVTSRCSMPTFRSGQRPPNASQNAARRSRAH